MRIVIQRVKEAKVYVKEKEVSKIKKGILILLGVFAHDTKVDADYIVKKIDGIRIFEDEQEKTNLPLNPQEHELLIVSQFTLWANCEKGKRPSFTSSATYNQGKELYEYVIEKFREKGYRVKTGIFGEKMDLHIINTGPYTILIDSKKMIKF